MHFINVLKTFMHVCDHMWENSFRNSIYMDDLKLIAKSKEELQKQIQTIKTFSDDINMEFDLKNMPRLRLREAN